MKRFKILGAMLICLFLICLFFLRFLTSEICFSKNCLKVEIADTPQKRSEGLMYRTSLPQERGMLFIFPRQDFWSFWMKNTLIPLDIIWMDAQGVIVDICENVQPWVSDREPPSLRPVYKAKYVLEANAGFARRAGLQPHHKARFKWIFNSKKL